MNLFRRLIIVAAAVMAAIISIGCNNTETVKQKALVVSGQNNHNWEVSHKVLKLILDNSGMFETDIALTAPAGGDMSGFKPDFSAYDVVVLDYNGDRWPAETDAAFLDYVKNGGGVIVYHAADNAFAGCTGLISVTISANFKNDDVDDAYYVWFLCVCIHGVVLVISYRFNYSINNFNSNY